MTGKGGTAHATAELLERYATGDTGIQPDVLWALEAHLEGCADCRAGLVVDAGTAALLDQVRINLEPGLAVQPARPARRFRSLRWTIPSLVRWLAMTVLITLTAFLLDVAAQSGGKSGPSLLMLLAPVAPLLGVAAAWARGTDPAYELVAATPRAGLYLVLRRTLAVLVVVIPALTVAGLPVGASPARWLLPCLAFTAGTLAIGSVIGVPRAAGILAAGWVVGVVGPSVISQKTPLLLQPESLPAWLAVTAAVVLTVALRRGSYNRLPSGR
jgi:hypothetical protein